MDNSADGIVAANSPATTRPKVRRLIVPMTLNGSGIRDITRVLKVSINTVLKVLREQALRTPAEKLEIGFAHRTYQEFFLALYIRDNPQQFGKINVPKAVEEHLASIKDEGI